MSRGALALFLSVSVLWGLPYFLIEIALDDGFSPAFLAFARVAIGALVLVPFALAADAFKDLAGRARPLFALAALDVAAPFALIALAQRSISSSLAGILVATTPIFVALLALRLDPGEHLDARRLLGLLAGLAGVAALLGGDVDAADAALLGAVLVLVASLGYASATLIVKLRFGDVPPVAVTTASLSISAALLAVPAALTAPVTSPSMAATSSVIVLGVACTGVAFLLFYALIVAVGATRAALITYAAPAVAVVLGVIALEEPFTAATASGLSLILVGSWLAGRRAQRENSTSVPTPLR